MMRADGNLHAPRFLQVAAKSIRNTGKSVDQVSYLSYEEG